MERVRVGIIGAGNIGAAHARSLAGEVAGAEVTAIVDPDRQRARAVAATAGARVLPTVADLLHDAEVDAVLIASPDECHAEQALAALAVGKPMLVEKPLAPSLADAVAVMAAEAAGGRRLITVGFMRRFDPGFVQLKAQLDSGCVGAALLVRCIHRNARASYGLRSDRTMTNMLIHDMDSCRWLLGEELTSVQVITPRPGPDTPPGQFDPMLVLFRSASGAVIEMEAFANAGYGYEVSCHVVAERGLLDMTDGGYLRRTEHRRQVRDIPEQWLGRFGEAYRLEMQAWVDMLHGRDRPAANTWDGVAATAAACAAVTAIATSEWIDVTLPDCPDLYRCGT